MVSLINLVQVIITCERKTQKQPTFSPPPGLLDQPAVADKTPDWQSAREDRITLGFGAGRRRPKIGRISWVIYNVPGGHRFCFINLCHDMAYLQKIRSFFASITHRKSNIEHSKPNHQNADDNRREENSHHKNQPILQQEQDDSDDPCAALSEIAAPEPVEKLSEAELAAPETVEKLSEAELARHPSLEQGYEYSRGDIYPTLSEIAAPGPVERLSEEAMARQPSLEKRLSQVSHQ